MGQVTGTGCQLSALLAAALASAPVAPLSAVTETAALMGIAGELARARMEEHDGNASYRTRIIDAICCMTAQELADHAKITSV